MSETIGGGFFHNGACMAATDKPFHNPRTLDIVFGVSNILMLLSVVWMFVQDHVREYKAEQRAFRPVEVEVAKRMALKDLPNEEEFKSAEKAVEKASADRQQNTAALATARSSIASLQPQKERAEANFQAVKADVESITSFLNIAREHNEAELAARYENDLTELNKKLEVVQAKRDEIVNKMKLEQAVIENIEGPYTKAVANFKKVNDKLDTQVKLALNKRWGWGDWFRTLPVIDGFASPLRIHQFTINDIPIDYNFKMVTRYDRCMSCHVGIDRPAYTKANLESLTQDDPNADKLEFVQKLYDSRVKALEGSSDAAVIPNPHGLTTGKLSDSVLTPSRIREFAAHPRLDLFVGSNSKHPAEAFGCSSCHYGQGSGTSFTDASHNPNSSVTRAHWEKDRAWQPNHMWDFPMLPTRFVESSCLKCHHEVTDLISRDNRSEAPKVLRGHQLIKENGCFGCHEISGYRAGARVGPDLRLEPSTPLEKLDPIEQERVKNDPDNRIGDLRKVGPSLARVNEKVSRDWIEKWLLSPTNFRPDTKMPHYYGLSTNDESVLPEAQKKFPNTEIASIAYFLAENSKTYLDDAKKVRQDDAQIRQKDKTRLQELLIKGRLTAAEQDELARVKWRIKLRDEVALVDLAPGYAGDAKKGRVLFTERGCLACHAHEGTETAQTDKGLFAADLKSEAVFGPNLSQLPAKFGKDKKDKDAARVWLLQWITNPQVHSPRSRMPVTHLTPHEAADITTWLLNQPAKDLGEKWNDLQVTEPKTAELKQLAEVYLTRMLSKADMERFLQGMSPSELAEFRKDDKISDANWRLILADVNVDERKLLKDGVDNDGALKYYLGKKAVSRLGCFACHDIPGFENTKSIGVGLNDWGKKPVDRLAFEDIDNFYKKFYYHDGVDSLVDKDGKPHGIKDGKEPYEKFYAQALLGKSNLDDPQHGHQRQREGYLNQKIRDPRSYDYNRDRAWDDRSRMPKFHLARARKMKDEADADYKARVMKDEAEAREAVATFVLGLVAESVPVKSINRPSGDRLAEIKGRQILDKYNCNGCHLIRPGVYDFKLTGDTFKRLERAHRNFADEMKDPKTGGEYILLNHVNWVGRNPIGGDSLRAYGSNLTFNPEDPAYVRARLSEAIRFEGSDRLIKSLPVGYAIELYFADMGIDPESIKSVEDFNRVFSSSTPYGGAFANLLVKHLIQKDKQKYPQIGTLFESDEARAALPPSLIGEGERVRSEWLTQFLLNPEPIRPMSILRMPKFNMSEQEAQALVSYFTAVTRQTNPGIGLMDTTISRGELSGDYWKHKNAAYVEYLKKTKAADKDGKETKETLFKERVDAFTPVWEEIRAAKEAEAKTAIEQIKKNIDAQKAAEKKAAQAVTDEKDNAKKPALQQQLEGIQSSLKAAATEMGELEKASTRWSVKNQQERWEQSEAYVSDAYRLLVSRELCTKCHQVGSFAPSEPVKIGPPLALAQDRLRPDWIERWVNKPHRFVPYNSVMPAYFNKNTPQYQALHAGPAAEQLQALRDALSNFRGISALPTNAVHSPDRSTKK
jgi:cbb3-type cytochrome oxidase cytochrome c subunit